MRSVLGALLVAAPLLGSVGYPYGRVVPEMLGSPEGPRLVRFHPAGPRLAAGFSVFGAVVDERSAPWSAPSSVYNRVFHSGVAEVSALWSATRHVAVGVGTSPYRSFVYGVERKEGGTYRYKATGGIRSWHGVLRFSWPGRVWFEAVGRFLDGRGKEESLSWPDGGAEQSSTVVTAYRGWSVDAVLAVRPVAWLDVAALFVVPSELQAGSGRWRLPWEAGAAVEGKFFKDGRDEAAVVFEARYANGRGFRRKDAGVWFAPASFRDTLTVAAGCSFMAGPRSPLRLRFGWLWLPEMGDRYSDGQAVFVGGRLPLTADLSVHGDALFGLRPYRGDGVFFPSDATVQEERFGVMLGMTYAR